MSADPSVLERGVEAAPAGQAHKLQVTGAPARPRNRERASTPRHDGETRRDRYIDTLRASALVRVIAYHTFGFIWLPFLFPSMGIMFALAGALVASSLDRAEHNPWRVVRKRTRRLLPPLWMLGLVLVPVMLAHGWVAVADQGGVEFGWRAVLSWVVPLEDPGASDWGYEFTVPLWYIRAYFWFLLLSPAALFMFRRWPKRTMSLPIGVAVLSGFGVLDYSLTGTQGSAIVATMATYGACWMLGFAHHDGRLRGLSLRWVVPVSLVLLVVGAWWAGTRRAWELDDSTLGQALYCFGFVLLLLRFYPSFGWLARYPFLDKLVTVINVRAMTIYLWGNVAIFLAAVLLNSSPAPSFLATNALVFSTSVFVGAWLLLGVAIFAVGWVEDVAAGRRIRFNPWPKRVAQHRAAAPALRIPVPAPTSPRGLAAAFSLAAVAGAVAVFWVASDDSGDLAPGNRDARPITALHEPPPANLRGSSARDTDMRERSTAGRSESEGGLIAKLSQATDALLGTTPPVPAPASSHDATPAPTGTSQEQTEPAATSGPGQGSQPTTGRETPTTEHRPSRTPRPEPSSTGGTGTSAPSNGSRPDRDTGSSGQPTGSASNPQPSPSPTGPASGQGQTGADELAGEPNSDGGGSGGNSDGDGPVGGPSGTTGPEATSDPTPS